MDDKLNDFEEPNNWIIKNTIELIFAIICISIILKAIDVIGYKIFG
jgi:hypothetical protein